MRRLLGSIAVDTTALRESRDFRLLTLGEVVTGLGTQASIVALPYQVYILTRSPFLVGLIGLVELIPLVALSLLGGAIADRMDRRRLLLLSQIALVVAAGGLAGLAYAGSPPLVAIYVLAAFNAGASAVERVVRSAMVPRLVGPAQLRSALSFTFGMAQLTQVAGPALAGVLIAVSGVGTAYAVDAVTCAGMVLAALMMAPQPPEHDEEPEPVPEAIAAGLRFARRDGAIMGSFAIDLLAMTFGMPRALFPALALGVYGAGAGGTGALFAAVSAGATVAALTTGWLPHARWLGRIVIAAVTAWGAAIALAGLAGSIVVACVLFALAGAADSVSAVCRSTILQTRAPEAMRGRLSALFSLVVTSGPRLGDVESGGVASLVTVGTSVVSGGLACVAGVGLIVLAFPELAAYDGAAIRPAVPAP
ncbi:MAG TPA: MFS transporter [Solirubrobacteraceae bacterium]